MGKLDSITPGEVAGLDATEMFLRQHNFTNEYLEELMSDTALNERLIRKVDMILLPLLVGTYLLQYIDKSTMAYSAVFDLFTDTGISSEQYSWFASIFYFGYILAEYPWLFLAQKTRMAKVIAGCVLAWGSVLMLTAAGHNFGGLAACRFFLGVFEAPITTCFMMIVSMWYTREKQPFRAGIFYCANGIGSMARLPLETPDWAVLTRCTDRRDSHLWYRANKDLSDLESRLPRLWRHDSRLGHCPPLSPPRQHPHSQAIYP